MLYVEITESRHTTPRGEHYSEHCFVLSADGLLMKTGDARFLLDEAVAAARQRNDHITIRPGSGGGLLVRTKSGKPEILEAEALTADRLDAITPLWSTIDMSRLS